MKQACSLESMVDAVLSEMKRRGNAKNTIERHERAYSQFYEYALTQGENSYSKVLARSFLEEKEKLSAYRGPRFMEQYRIALNKLDDIAKGQDIRLRHLENGYHLKSSCFDWVIPFFEERLKRRLKNTYDVRTRLRIKDRSDAEGQCWPAIKTIGAELGLSRSTVKRALDDLCKAGLLQKDPRWRENGSYTSNLYRLL